MKTRTLMLTGALLVVCGTGCKVDSDYDLSKLETEITVLKGATFPVPSPKPIYLADILNLEGYKYIVVDDNGDYCISFDLDPVELSLEIPADATPSNNRIPTNFIPKPYTFDGVPDFLSADGQQVEPDLSEMELRLSIDSGVPALFTVSTQLETFQKGALKRSYSVDNLAIPYGKTEYCLRERSDGSAGSIQVPELGKLLSPVPDEFKISALDVFATDDQLALLTPGSAYDILCLTSVWSPISFSENTRFQVSTPLDAQLSLEPVGLKKVALHMDVENTIPLDFTVDLYALDSDGQRIETIKFSDSGSVSIPGRKTSSASLTLTTQGDLRFSSLVLDLTASSNPEIAGIHFNRTQLIRFSNLYLELPDGIQVKMDGVGK